MVTKKWSGAKKSPKRTVEKPCSCTFFFAVQTDDTKLVILAFNLIAEKTCTLRFLFCRCFRSCFKRFFPEQNRKRRLVLLPFSLFVTGLEPFGTKRFGEDASVFWPKDPNTNALFLHSLKFNESHPWNWDHPKRTGHNFQVSIFQGLYVNF